MKKQDTKENARLAREIADAARRNPRIDLRLFREWQAMMEVVESVPKPARPNLPAPPKNADNAQPRLQKIPLEIFERR